MPTDALIRTQLCVRRSTLLLLLLLLLLKISGAQAAGFDVIEASTHLDKGVYRLSAQIEYSLSGEAVDALQNGVPLTIELVMEVRRRRAWVWDETVYSLSQYFRLEYHALSRQYLVHNRNSGEQRNFSTRTAALRFMGQIHQFPLLDSSLLEPNQRYEGALQARLDLDTLPAPLRVLAYFSEDWQLSSEWYTWPL